RTSSANDPNAAKIDVCGCWITLSANAKTAGITIAARAALFSASVFGTIRPTDGALLIPLVGRLLAVAGALRANVLDVRRPGRILELAMRVDHLALRAPRGEALPELLHPAVEAVHA